MSGQLPSGDRGVVVKNTFLEVGDHTSLLERSDGWRRQTSEPVKIYTTKRSGEAGPPQDTLSELDESEDADGEFLDGGVVSPYATGVDNSGGAEACSSSWDSSSAKPPQVLLLSESIPFKRGKGAPPGTASQQAPAGSKDRPERKEAAPKEGGGGRGHDDITKKQPPWTNVTTVMMRNLPNKYTQQMLLEELQDAGFKLQQDFDFFYLPMDHSNNANLGYCFINFVATHLANEFAAAFEGKKMRRFNSNKTVVVMPASMQGFERNYAYYSSTRVAQAEDPAYRPLFIKPTSQATGGKGGGGCGAKSKGGAKNSAVAPPAGDRNPGNVGRGKGNNDRRKPSSKDDRSLRDDLGLSSDSFIGGNFPDVFPSSLVGGLPNLPTGVGGGPAPGGPALQGLFQQSAGPPPPPVGNRICGNCGNEVGPVHRFCAFCGSFVGQDAPSAPSSQSQAAMLAAQAPYMRADAPTFVPGGGGGPSMPCRQKGGGGPSCGGGLSPLDADLARIAGLGLPPQSPYAPQGPPLSMRLPEREAPDHAKALRPQPIESVTDELDVMRGRQMLLAALKDIERREAGGRNDLMPPQGGAFGVVDGQW